MLAPRSTIAGLALVAIGCASAPPCPRERTCGAASWTAASNGGIDARMIVAPAVASSGSPSAGSESLAAGTRAVLLRFDLTALAPGDEIDHAVLALAPHARWIPHGVPVRVFARAITSEWSAQSLLATGTPTLAPDPTTSATIPGTARTPLRLDVTAALRAWRAGQSPLAGFAVSTDGAVIVLAGLGSAAPADRPRLEVAVR